MQWYGTEDPRAVNDSPGTKKTAKSKPDEQRITEDARGDQYQMSLLPSGLVSNYL